VPVSLKRLLVGLAFSALGNGLTLPLLIVYLHEIRGIPTTTAGLVVAWIAAVQFSFTPVVGWLIEPEHSAWPGWRVRRSAPWSSARATC